MTISKSVADGGDEPVRRILLVDDDEQTQALRRYLELSGYGCEVAGHRELALSLMKGRQFELIVVDPFLTGVRADGPAELLTSIRHLQPNAAIVVVTAYDSPELKVIGAARGVSRTVSKPLPVTTLFEILMGVPRPFTGLPVGITPTRHSAV